jgi:hypothetical protein
MIKKTIGAIAVAGSLIGFAGCRHHHSSHCWGPTPEERGEWIVKKVSKKLDLNEAQKGALQDVADQLLAVKKEMHQEQEQIHKEILAMISAEKLNSDRLLEIVESKQKVVDDKAPLIIEKIAVFHSTLNKEQKEKIANQFKKHVPECD